MSKMLLLIFAVASITLSACNPRQECLDAYIGFRLTGFSPAAYDTIEVQSFFRDDTAFQHPLASVVLHGFDSALAPFIHHDTVDLYTPETTTQDTMNWRFYFPATGEEIFITGIEQQSPYSIPGTCFLFICGKPYFCQLQYYSFLQNGIKKSINEQDAIVIEAP